MSNWPTVYYSYCCPPSADIPTTYNCRSRANIFFHRVTLSNQRTYAPPDAFIHRAIGPCFYGFLEIPSIEMDLSSKGYSPFGPCRAGGGVFLGARGPHPLESTYEIECWALIA